MRLILFSLCVSLLSHAAADYTLLQDVVGSYPIVEFDGDPRVSGTAVVFATDEGVGFELIPGHLSSLPVTALKVSTPKDKTLLTRVGNRVRQEYKTNDANTSVEYLVQDGFVSIAHNSCDFTAASCSSKKIQLTSGKGPDVTMAAEEFFTFITGDYQVELSGGHAPKVENQYASAFIEDGEALVTFPYCHPGTTVCDIGTVFFPLARTLVYKKLLGPDHEVYTILDRDGSDLYHFSWEINQGRVTYRNYQYNLPNSSEVITLEFVAVRQ